MISSDEEDFGGDIPSEELFSSGLSNSSSSSSSPSSDDDENEGDEKNDIRVNNIDISDDDDDDDGEEEEIYGNNNNNMNNNNNRIVRPYKSQREKMNCQILYESIKKGDIKTMKIISQRIGNLGNKTFNNHWKDCEVLMGLKEYKYRFVNLLFYCVFFNEFKMLRFLVEEKLMEVNQHVISTEESLLHVLVKNNHRFYKENFLMMLYLMEKGLDLNLKDKKHGFIAHEYCDFEYFKEYFEKNESEEMNKEEFIKDLKDKKYVIKNYEFLKPYMGILKISRKQLLKKVIFENEKNLKNLEIDKTKNLEIDNLKTENLKLKQRIQVLENRKVGWNDIFDVLPGLIGEEHNFFNRINEVSDDDFEDDDEEDEDEGEDDFLSEEDGLIMKNNLDHIIEEGGFSLKFFRDLDVEVEEFQRRLFSVPQLEYSEFSFNRRSEDSEIVSFFNGFTSLSNILLKICQKLEMKRKFLYRNRNFTKLRKYFTQFYSKKGSIKKDFVYFTNVVQFYMNNIQKSLTFLNEMNEIFENYRNLLSFIKNEDKEIKKLKFKLELNEEYLTETQENKILEKISRKRKNFQSKKRKLEKLQNLMYSIKLPVVENPKVKNRSELKLKVLREFFLKMNKTIKSYYNLSINDLSTSKKKRNRNIIDLFIKRNLFLHHRELKDYANLVLLYLNNNNKIYKGYINNKRVVIKCLPYTEKNEKYIQNEIFTLLGLSHHPSIISINCCFLYKDTYTKSEYVAMEMDYIDYDLLHWIKKVNTRNDIESENPETKQINHMKLMKNYPIRRSKENVKNVLKQIANALSFIHSKNIIHADLKPQNILIEVNPSLKVKIIDFGISKNSNSFYFFTTLNGSGDTENNETIVDNPNSKSSNLITSYTLRYKAPEMKITKAYDIFSFGKILYECIIPDMKYLDSIYVLNEKLNLPSHILNKNEEDLIRLCMNPNPFRRITAHEIVNHPFFGYDEITELKKNRFDKDMKMNFVVNFLREISNKISAENSSKYKKLIVQKSKTLNVYGSNNQLLNSLREFKLLNKGNLSFEVLNYLNECNSLDELLIDFDVQFFNLFEKETGIDQGGLSNELYYLFDKCFVKFFLMKEEETYLPIDKSIIEIFKIFDSNNTNRSIKNHNKDLERGLIRFIFFNFGKYVLRILFLKENTLNINFTNFFYCFLIKKEHKSLHKRIQLCEQYDGVFTQNLEKLLLENEDDVLKDFSFVNDSGKEEVVNTQNSSQFLSYKLRQKLYGMTDSSVPSFRSTYLNEIRRGFFHVLNNTANEKLRKIVLSLSELELKKLMCGQNRENIDYNAIRSVIQFDELLWSINQNHKMTKTWFIAYLKSLTNKELLRFLYYATNLNGLPLAGSGDASILQKKVKVIPNDSRFYAHTCITIRKLEIKTGLESYEQFKAEFDNILSNLENAGIYEDQ